MCKKHGNNFNVIINDEVFCEKCFEEQDYSDYLKEQQEKSKKVNYEYTN